MAAHGPTPAAAGGDLGALLAGAGPRRAAGAGPATRSSAPSAIIVAALAARRRQLRSSCRGRADRRRGDRDHVLWSRAVEGPRQARNRLMTLLIVSPSRSPCCRCSPCSTRSSARAARASTSTSSPSRPVASIGAGGGAEHAIVGTLVITAIATVISVPIGIMAADLPNEYGGTAGSEGADLLRRRDDGDPVDRRGAVRLRALRALPRPRHPARGSWASLALSVLMIPIIIRSAEEILKIVPNHLREAAYALGTPKWRTIVRIVLPDGARRTRDRGHDRGRPGHRRDGAAAGHDRRRRLDQL